MIKTKVKLDFDGVLELGYPGENEARGFEFDVSEWMGVFTEGGSLALLAKRPWEPDYYPCVLEVDGTTATWVVGLADVAIPGNNGKVVLQYKIGDTVVRSRVFPTVICEGIGGDQGEVPEPQEPWVQQVLDAADKIVKLLGQGIKAGDDIGIAVSVGCKFIGGEGIGRDLDKDMLDRIARQFLLHHICLTVNRHQGTAEIIRDGS